MRLDDEWIRINEDFEIAGNRQMPQFARQMRSDGGMIVGRIVRESSMFDAQVYKRGEFAPIAKPFGSFAEAELALRQYLPRNR